MPTRMLEVSLVTESIKKILRMDFIFSSVHSVAEDVHIIGSSLQTSKRPARVRK